MAMHLTPAEHNADPPSSWTVRKNGPKSWSLCSSEGHVKHTTTTKKEAEALKTSGFYFNLYNDEGRWFNGEKVRNWNIYVPKEGHVKAIVVA